MILHIWLTGTIFGKHSSERWSVTLKSSSHKWSSSAQRSSPSNANPSQFNISTRWNEFAAFPWAGEHVHLCSIIHAYQDGKLSSAGWTSITQLPCLFSARLHLCGVASICTCVSGNLCSALVTSCLKLFCCRVCWGVRNKAEHLMPFELLVPGAHGVWWTVVVVFYSL